MDGRGNTWRGRNKDELAGAPITKKLEAPSEEQTAATTKKMQGWMQLADTLASSVWAGLACAGFPSIAECNTAILSSRIP